MKKNLLLALLTFIFLVSFEALGKRKRRKWSLSISNGYTFYSMRKGNQVEVSDFSIGTDGQMNHFFSNLEIRRNFKTYEVGGKIQFFDEAFISPFVKMNFVKNRSRTAIIPYLTVGVVPSRLMGAYLRLGLDLAVNRYFAVSPFFGAYVWHKVKEAPYGRYNVHMNGGITTTLYF